jgi:hypothetical protein
MDKQNYFSTPIWAEDRPEFLKSLNKLESTRVGFLFFKM